MSQRWWISSLHPPVRIAKSKKVSERKTRTMHSYVPEGDDPRIEAARYRLQTVTDHDDALEAIREIIANLFGSEEMALYRVDRERAAMWLTWSFGIDPYHHGMIDLLDEPALERVFKGEPFIADERGHYLATGTSEPVTAFLPIRSHEQTVAVLAIMKLLPQKQSIEAADLRLFQMLSNEIANALSPNRAVSFLSRLLEEEEL